MNASPTLGIVPLELHHQEVVAFPLGETLAEIDVLSLAITGGDGLPRADAINLGGEP